MGNRGWPSSLRTRVRFMFCFFIKNCARLLSSGVFSFFRVKYKFYGILARKFFLQMWVNDKHTTRKGGYKNNTREEEPKLSMAHLSYHELAKQWGRSHLLLTLSSIPLQFQVLKKKIVTMYLERIVYKEVKWTTWIVRDMCEEGRHTTVQDLQIKSDDISSCEIIVNIN